MLFDPFIEKTFIEFQQPPDFDKGKASLTDHFIECRLGKPKVLRRFIKAEQTSYDQFRVLHWVLESTFSPTNGPGCNVLPIECPSFSLRTDQVDRPR